MDKIKKKLKQKQENKNVISTLILLFSLLGFISLIILMSVKIKEVDNLIHDANESIKEKQFGIKAIQNMVSDIKTNNTNLLNKIEKLKHDLMGVKVQYDDNLLKIGKAENEKKSIRTLEFPMIMKTIEDKDFVMSTLPYASQNFYNMKLLYKASRDGRTKEDFYNTIQSISSLLCNGSSIVFDYPTYEDSKETQINEKLASGAKAEMKAKYSYKEIEKMLSDNGLLIYEHLNNEEMTNNYFDNYNTLNPNNRITAPKGVCYCLAVKKQ